MSFIEEQAAIEVRPVNGTATVAKLPGALPAQGSPVTATIKTEDPDGPLVEYALLALDPHRCLHEPIFNKRQPTVEPGGFSGWLPIHPDFTTQIHLNLVEPAIKPLDLYLATRLARGQTAESAPARWLEFVVDAFHETLTQCSAELARRTLFHRAAERRTGPAAVSRSRHPGLQAQCAARGSGHLGPVPGGRF